MKQFKITLIKPKTIGFLEIIGHNNSMLLDQIEAKINAFQPKTRKNTRKEPVIEFNRVYLARVEDTRFRRCVVLAKCSNNKLVIKLIDFGNEFEIDASCVSRFENSGFLFCFHLFHKLRLL